MIELIKIGKINNRLLCEMATHESFRKLMTDLEIYVDRIASMQISNLNVIVDVARVEIENKCNPSAEDQYIQTLKVARVDEDNCFAHMIHDDMDVIAIDIRSAHTNDFDIAPETSVADTIREGIEETANFKGSAKETQLFLLCHQLGLDYKSLSSEEFTALMKALNRSKKLKTGTNQHGCKGKRR